jgi:rhodanese-related sulfurtransferase
MMAPWWSPFGQIPEISAGELHARLTHGVKIQLLDVRTRREFARGHITGAVNVPIQSFRRELPRLDLDGSRPVVTVCKTAHRSPAATPFCARTGLKLFSLPRAWMNGAARNSLSSRRDAGGMPVECCGEDGRSLWAE